MAIARGALGRNLDADDTLLPGALARDREQDSPRLRLAWSHAC
jgi:hypothetical protein